MAVMLVDLIKKWKDIIGFVILLISTGISAYTWVTTKFALKEYVDYNNCYMDKHILGNDYTMKIYVLNNDLAAQYQKEADWEAKFGSGSIPATELTNYRKINDEISSTRSDIRGYEDKKKSLEDRDCVKESHTSK